MIRSCFFPVVSVDAFMSYLYTSLNIKCGWPLGWEPVTSSPYGMSLGILPLPMHLTWPRQCIWHCISRLCMLGVLACTTFSAASLMPISTGIILSIGPHQKEPRCESWELSRPELPYTLPRPVIWRGHFSFIQELDEEINTGNSSYWL